jgi:hypothetical protein
MSLLHPVAGLDKADRRGDDQLASAGFLIARGQRPLPQEIEFIFGRRQMTSPLPRRAGRSSPCSCASGFNASHSPRGLRRLLVPTVLHIYLAEIHREPMNIGHKPLFCPLSITTKTLHSKPEFR